MSLASKTQRGSHRFTRASCVGYQLSSWKQVKLLGCGVPVKGLDKRNVYIFEVWVIDVRADLHGTILVVCEKLTTGLRD